MKINTGLWIEPKLKIAMKKKMIDIGEETSEYLSRLVKEDLERGLNNKEAEE